MTLISLIRNIREVDLKRSLLTLIDLQMSLTSKASVNSKTTVLLLQEDLTFVIVDRYMEQVAALPNLPLPSYSADFLDRALLELQQNDFDTEKALENVSHLTREDFDHLEEWTPEDIAAFEDGIRAYGHELHSVASKVPKRSMAQIVRFFYKWKKTDRYEPVYSEWTKIYKPK
jgi:hypothetical protein